MQVKMVGLSAPGTRFCPAHTHRQWEIVLCLTGSGILRVGDREIPYEPGCIVCQPPEVPHGVESDGGIMDLWVRVEDFLPPDKAEVPVYRDDDGGHFRILLKMLYEFFVNPPPGGEGVVPSLWEAAYRLLGSFGGEKTAYPAVQALRRAMILHLSDPDFSPLPWMEASGYSADHFRRCFRRETGRTPTDYLLWLRLDHARKLLALPERGGYSVREIIDTARRVTGREIPARGEPRRAGDPSVLIASHKKAVEVLGWQPVRGLEEIISDAWAWHSGHPNGYEG